VGLCWYISGACAVLHLMSLLISYVPEAERFVVTVQIASASVALAAAAAALRLRRLPTDHWIHHYRPLWFLLVAITIFVTLLLVAVG